MTTPGRTRPSRGHPGGFTLIELALVVAILAILTALSVAGWQRLRRASALQNAANDFSAVLSRARSRAIERQTDVWLVIFPHRLRNGTASPSPGGMGSYFMVEDVTGSFAASGYAAFTSPPLVAAPAKLLHAAYLQDYASGQVVRFIVGSTSPLIPAFPSSTSAFSASPFSALNAGLSAGTFCNFCGGTGAAARGAIIFSGEGTARFVNDAGVAQITGGTATADSRVGFVSISEENTVANHRRGYVFAISKPTAFVAMYSSP